METYYIRMIFQGNGAVRTRYAVQASSKEEAESLAEKEWRKQGPLRLDCYAETVQNINPTRLHLFAPLNFDANPYESCACDACIDAQKRARP